VRGPYGPEGESGVILVTGATGRVGYRLMEALADTGADATAMVRVEAKAADLPGTPRHVVATFDDPPPAEVLRGFDRQVDYENQSAKRAREVMLASGMDGWEADGNLELFEWVRDGGAATVTDTVREVTGADPQPIQDWLSDARASFVGPPPDLPPPAF
jgi:nucleoside-diphosphate-sugar epimerase